MKKEEKLKIPAELAGMQLKWKKKHWYFALAFNTLVPGAFLIERVAYGSSGSIHWSFLVFVPTAIMTFLMLYMFKAFKYYKEHEVLIKEDRSKNFYRGISCSFLSYCLLVIGLCVASKHTAEASAVIYSFLGITCVTGTASSAFLSFYEFCVSFDIFYSKNKEKIVEHYLKQSGDFKIKEDDLAKEPWE